MENQAGVLPFDNNWLINLFRETRVLSIDSCSCSNQLRLIVDESRIDKCVYECNKCLKKTSIRKNSWLFNSKLTLNQHYQFITLWSQNVELKTIQNIASIKAETAVKLNKFWYEMAVNAIEASSEPIGGPGSVVEIESKFGKMKYHRGHKVDGQWVFGGIECGCR